MVPFIIVIIYFVIFYVCIVQFGKRRFKKFNNEVNAYAVAHGFKTNTQAHLPPALEKLGYNASETILEGTIDGQIFRLYNCIPPRISNQQYQTITLCSMDYPQVFPDFLIIPRLHVLGASEILHIANKNMAKQVFGFEELNLEGDFKSYFETYTPKGEEIDVLSYLAPDLMANLEDYVGSIILFSGNYVSVSIYQPLNITKIDKMLKDLAILRSQVRVKNYTLQ